MRKFVITTTSESSDHYIYFIKHPKKPTNKELERFLKEYAYDKDTEQVYESVDDIEEIKEEEFLTIPSKDIK